MSQDYLPIEKPGLLPASDGDQMTTAGGFKSWKYSDDTSSANAVGRWVLVFDYSGSGGGGGGGTPGTPYDFRDGEGVRASTGTTVPGRDTPVVHNLDIDQLEDLT